MIHDTLRCAESRCCLFAVLPSLKLALVAALSFIHPVCAILDLYCHSYVRLSCSNLPLIGKRLSTIYMDRIPEMCVVCFAIVTSSTMYVHSCQQFVKVRSVASRTWMRKFVSGFGRCSGQNEQCKQCNLSSSGCHRILQQLMSAIRMSVCMCVVLFLSCFGIAQVPQ